MNHYGVGTLESYDPIRGILLYSTPAPPDYLVEKQRFEKAEVIFWDSRRLSPDQNAKAHAIINDIAMYTGYLPAEAKAWLKYHYISTTGADYFSMSSCDMTTARLFITWLIDFAALWDIPLTDLDEARSADTDAWLYICLLRRRCAVCFERHADPHHYKAIGMGRNRKTIVHLGVSLIALCRKCHKQAHRIGRETFSKKYKVYGIAADEKICEVYNLNIMEK